MYFEPAAVPSEAKVALPRFLAIVGRDAWRKRESTLQRNLQANPFLHLYYKETFALEFEIFGLRAHLNATARIPNNIHEYYKALVFIVTVDRIYRRLTESGRKGLKGRMLDGLRSQTYGLMPLASEIDVATHLMLRGFDVSFSDLERGGVSIFWPAAISARLKLT